MRGLCPGSCGVEVCTPAAVLQSPIVTQDPKLPHGFKWSCTIAHGKSKCHIFLYFAGCWYFTGQRGLPVNNVIAKSCKLQSWSWYSRLGGKFTFEPRSTCRAYPSDWAPRASAASCIHSPLKPLLLLLPNTLYALSCPWALHMPSWCRTVLLLCTTSKHLLRDSTQKKYILLESSQERIELSLHFPQGEWILFGSLPTLVITASPHQEILVSRNKMYSSLYSICMETG